MTTDENSNVPPQEPDPLAAVADRAFGRLGLDEDRSDRVGDERVSHAIDMLSGRLADLNATMKRIADLMAGGNT